MTLKKIVQFKQFLLQVLRRSRKFLCIANTCSLWFSSDFANLSWASLWHCASFASELPAHWSPDLTPIRKLLESFQLVAEARPPLRQLSCGCDRTASHQEVVFHLLLQLWASLQWPWLLSSVPSPLKACQVPWLQGRHSPQAPVALIFGAGDTREIFRRSSLASKHCCLQVHDMASY